MKNTIRKGDTVTIRGNGSNGIYHFVSIGSDVVVSRGRDLKGDYTVKYKHSVQFINEADIKLKS